MDSRWIPTRIGVLIAALRHHPRVMPAAVAVTWAATRIPVYLVLAARFPRGDVVTYARWAQMFIVGRFPVSRHWQYPPGAAVVLSLPRLLPGSYVGAFLLLALLADLAVTGLLVAMAIRHGGWLGCWCWLVGIPMLGTLALQRFDIFATLCAVCALSLAGSSRRGAGVVSGLGAAIKLWPVLVLVGLPRGRARAAIAAATAMVGVIAGGFLIFTHGSLNFLHNQRGRGIEIESVGAVPFLLLHNLRLWHGSSAGRYGSTQLIGPGVATMSRVLVAASVLALIALAYWRRRLVWRPAATADAALVATLLVLVTSRVLSPQYLVWLLGTTGCALAFRASTQRPVALLVLVASLLTSLDFPIYFTNLGKFRAAGVTVVTLRDAVLVAAACLGCVRLWGPVGTSVRARPPSDGN